MTKVMLRVWLDGSPFYFNIDVLSHVPRQTPQVHGPPQADDVLSGIIDRPGMSEVLVDFFSPFFFFIDHVSRPVASVASFSPPLC